MSLLMCFELIRNFDSLLGENYGKGCIRLIVVSGSFEFFFQCAGDLFGSFEQQEVNIATFLIWPLVQAEHHQRSEVFLSKHEGRVAVPQAFFATSTVAAETTGPCVFLLGGEVC